MEINGSGGSLIERKYRLPVTVIWQLALDTAREMEISLKEVDEKEHLFQGSLLTGEKTFLFGEPKKKEVSLVVTPVEEGCQVILDIHKERIEVYSFRPQNKETEAFMKRLEAKMRIRRTVLVLTVAVRFLMMPDSAPTAAIFWRKEIKKNQLPK